MEAGEESQLTPQVHLARRAVGARAVLPVALALAAGLTLRLWMLRNVFEVNGDSLIYGGLAKNLLLHGQFDLTLPSGEMYATLIRLPGYPMFLAVCFRLFGMENYYSAACVQIVLELLGCLLLAGFVRRIAPAGMGRSAAMATLWLAALCPFTACYTAEPLTETPTLFVLALAMWAMARFREEPKWANALWFTAAVTCATLLRPDGALAAIAFAPAMVIGLQPGDGRGKIGRGRIPRGKLARMTAVCVLLSLAPFAVWTARNWSVFHVIEPLAPRLATDPGESANPGWERWVKSWCLDFISTFEIYWNVPGDKLDVGELPSRAFDSPAQHAETAALAADYNSSGMELTPEIDKRFGRLAEERIAANPARYYAWLPLGRVADMWLRPRVENLPIDLNWWVYAHHHEETEFSWGYAGLNAIYLLVGIAGLIISPQRPGPVAPPQRAKIARREPRVIGDPDTRPRFWGALLAYMVLRSALLLTVEAPETRYTLECFPMLFAGGGIALAWLGRRVYLASKLKAPLGSG